MIIDNKTAVILGAGSIGVRHAKNLIERGIDVTFVRREIDKGFDDKYGVTSTTWQEFEYSDLRFDYGFICTPTNKHIEDLTLLSNKSDKIFLEKPLCSNLIQLDGELGDVKAKVIFIGFMLRFHPSIKSLYNEFSLVSEQCIGANYHFGSYMPGWHPNEDYRHGYAGRKSMGGGVVRTISHEIDLAVWFHGIPESVTARYTEKKHLEIDCEENAFISFHYISYSVNIGLNYLEKVYNRQIQINCLEERFHWEWDKNVVYKTTYSGLHEVSSHQDFDVNQLYKDELEFFLETKEFDNSCNLNHAIQIQRIIEALDESNRDNKTVKL